MSKQKQNQTTHDGGIVLSEGTYYKLKVRVLELANHRAQVQQLSDLLVQKQQLAYVEAGLDQTKNYRLDDATLTVVEITPPAV